MKFEKARGVLGQREGRAMVDVREERDKVTASQKEKSTSG